MGRGLISIFLHPYAHFTIDLLHYLPYMTIFGKTDHLRASTEIHFLPIRESYIHALSRNTKCLTIDGQVCFYGWPFADAVEPRGCISWP